MTLLYAYNFDEASGNILDASGNGRNTTFGGFLTRTASGGGHSGTGSDKALSQSTTSPDSAGPALAGLQTAEFTLMCWVKRSSNSVDGWVGEIKDAGSGDRGILFLSSNVQARARNSGGTVANVSTAQPVVNVWYHVAASYSTADSKVHLFINGSEIGTGTALTGPLKTTSTSSSLFDGIGAETVIDDVRYYDAALSAAQITTLMGQPVSAGAGLTLGLVTETDSGFALVKTKSKDLGLTSETGSPFSLVRQKALTIGLASETDSAFAVTRFKSLGLALDIETDSALPVSQQKSMGLSLVATSDTASPMAPSKALALGLAPEAGSALSLSGSKSLSFGVTQEDGVAPPMAPAKATTLGMVAGAESALTMNATKNSPFGSVAESDTALALSRIKSIPLGLPTEIDTVFALNLTVGATLVLGLITETSSPLGLSRNKSQVLGVASTFESVASLSRGKMLVLGQPTESDSAFVVSMSKSLLLGLPQVTDLALVLDFDAPLMTLKLWRNGKLISVGLENLRVYRFGHLDEVVEMRVTGHAEG